MPVGIVVSKTQLDAVSGSIARDLKQALENVIELNTWLVAQADIDLITLGYTAGEIAVLKSAYTDAAELAALFAGAATLSLAKDFRQFLKQLWGISGLQAHF